MHVVFHSSGEDGWTIELFRDTAEIRVERVARGFVAQKLTAEADDGLWWRRGDECKRRKGIVACEEDGKSRRGSPALT
jgi:hypothetical protein